VRITKFWWRLKACTPSAFYSYCYLYTCDCLRRQGRSRLQDCARIWASCRRSLGNVSLGLVSWARELHNGSNGMHISLAELRVFLSLDPISAPPPLQSLLLCFHTRSPLPWWRVSWSLILMTWMRTLCYALMSGCKTLFSSSSSR